MVAKVQQLDGMPDWEMVFRFTSGRLCLAFCATVGERWRRSFERLRSPDDLSRWLLQANITSKPVAVSDRQLQDARQLREAIYRLVLASMAGEHGSEPDRRLLNKFARQPTVPAQITTSWEREPWLGTDPTTSGLATVAADGVDLLTSPAMGRVRECEAPDCALLFIDLSRPGRRRWCADGACGSRSRSAAYRSRHAAKDASTPTKTSARSAG